MTPQAEWLAPPPLLLLPAMPVQALLPPTPPEPYWVVLLNESSGQATAEDYPQRSELVARLRKLAGRGYRAFVFQGRRLKISKPPYRYLIDGTVQIPLFEVKLVADEDESGSLDNPPEGEQDPVYRSITLKALEEDAMPMTAEAMAAFDNQPGVSPEEEDDD